MKGFESLRTRSRNAGLLPTMSIGTRFLRSDATTDYVALDWGNESVRCIAARIDDGRLTVLNVEEAEWPVELAEVHDVQATAEHLRRFVQTTSLKSPKALIVVPRDAVVIRRLDLPDVPDNELPDLVRLQAATKLATPVDKLALDYIPLSARGEHPGRSVLLVSLEQDRLRKLSAAVEAAGMQPAGCFTSSICVADLALRSAGSVADSGLSLVVYQHRNRLELSALLDRQLIFSYSLTLPDEESAGHTQPLMAELSRVLVAVRQVRHEAEIERVFVIQDGVRDEQVLTTLEERFGGQLRVLTSEDFRRGTAIDGAVTAHTPGAALGALVAEAAPRIPAVDFLRPRRAVAQADPRLRLKQFAAAAAGVLVVVGGLTYYSMLASRSAQIADLEDRRSELEALLNKPQSKTTIASAGALNAWSDEVASPLAVLGEFQELAPGTGRLYFTRLQFTPQTGEATARLTGDGLAREERDVVSLQQKLADAGHVVTYKPSRSSAVNPDYPIAFELNVSIMPAKAPDEEADEAAS